MTGTARRRSSRIPAPTSAAVAGVVVAGVVLAGVLAVPAGATADPVPAIDWRPCVPADAREQDPDPDPGQGQDQDPDPAEARHDVQCADVRVPVDHADPDGRTFTVAVTRIPATGERTGVLFGNPGGPGIDARGMWIDAVDRVFDTAVDELNRTHDLVTVQPRGLAGAGETACPGMGADMPYTARAWACHEADPEFVGSLTTANVVRDTETVRRLMGLGRIGFLGYSYGTAVGMAYLSLFPESLDRVVLDSSVGPASTWWKQSEATAALHRQPARDAFLTWIAHHDAAYGLGTTARQVYWRLREHDQQAGDRARRYLPPPGETGSVSAGSLSGSLAGSLSGSADGVARLGVRVDDAIGAAAGRYTRPSEVGESAFAVLDRNAGFPSMWPGEAAELSWLVGERPRVAAGPPARVPAVYDAAGGLGDADGGADDWGADDYRDDDEVTTADRDTYIGILRCAENTTPPDPRVEPSLDLALRLGSSADTVAHLRHRTLACPFPAASAPPATRAPAGAVRPLVLQSDGDPFTPPGPARLTAEATGGVLVRVRGVQHALFGYGNPGVDAVVLRYLRTGETTDGLHLPAAPDPVPW